MRRKSLIRQKAFSIRWRAVYPGVTFREVHDAEGPTRLNFRACWRQANCNPSLRPFLDMLRERYPDIVGAPALGSI